MRASINEAAPGGAGTDLGTPLGALESLRARDACGAAGAAAADDALGECWTVDGGRLPGEEQAEPSTTTKVWQRYSLPTLNRTIHPVAPSLFIDRQGQTQTSGSR